MKKLFTPESLDRFLEEIRLRSLLKRVNYGRSYPLTSHYGDNPYAEAMGNLGGTINAYLVVDGKNVDATIIALPMSDQVRSANRSGYRNATPSMHAESMAASGSRKKEKPPTEGIEFYVDVPGYRILDSTVTKNGVETSGVCEDGRLNFVEAETNPFYASKDATAELRVLRDDESSLLPPDSVAGKVAEGEESPAPSRHHEEDTGLANKSGDAYLEARFEEFTDLAAKYWPRIKRYLLTQVGNEADAEELTQDAFVDAIANLHKFEGRSTIGTWIHGIARHKALGYHRKNKLRTEDPRSALSLYASESPLDPEDTHSNEPIDVLIAVEEREVTALKRKKAVQAAIDKIQNEDHRRTIVMYYFDAMKYEQIAEARNRPIGTIKGWLNRAKSTLHDLLSSSFDSDDY